MITQYSQNDEQKFILEYCPGNFGSFLDIGAYDGVTFSNTLALAERGWNGVLLEPDPANYYRLSKIHPDTSRFVTVQAALAKTTGPMKFFTTGGDALSSSDARHMKKWKGQTTFLECTVDGISFADLVRRWPGPFRFVNLDVEGQNFELLQTMNLDVIGCRVLCVEYDDQLKGIIKWLGPEWRQVYRSQENIVMVR